MGMFVAPVAKPRGRFPRWRFVAGRYSFRQRRKGVGVGAVIGVQLHGPRGRWPHWRSTCLRSAGISTSNSRTSTFSAYR
jgi:hypothetical protein